MHFFNQARTFLFLASYLSTPGLSESTGSAVSHTYSDDGGAGDGFIAFLVILAVILVCGCTVTLAVYCKNRRHRYQPDLAAEEALPDGLYCKAGDVETETHKWMRKN